MIADHASLQNLTLTVSAADTYVDAINNVTFVEVPIDQDGDTHATLPTDAPGNEKSWSEQVLFDIDGRLILTVFSSMVVPLHHHPPPHHDGVCHVAFPVASEVRTFPTPGDPLVIATAPAIPTELRISNP